MLIGYLVRKNDLDYSFFRQYIGKSFMYTPSHTTTPIKARMIEYPQEKTLKLELEDFGNVVVKIDENLIKQMKRNQIK